MGISEAWRYNLFLALIVLCVCVGAYFVFKLRRETEEDSSPTTEKDLLREIEQAFYAGEMDREEFERAKELALQKLALLEGASKPADSPANRKRSGPASPPEA
jgi:hypothetical protein